MRQIATATTSTVVSVIACKSARDLLADSACVIYINSQRHSLRGAQIDHGWGRTMKYFTLKYLKKFMKYFKTTSLDMIFLNFHYKVLKTFKNMIKIYEVSRKYILLFMHNNKYLPLSFNWFTYFVVVNYTACTHSPS